MKSTILVMTLLLAGMLTAVGGPTKCPQEDTKCPGPSTSLTPGKRCAACWDIRARLKQKINIRGDDNVIVQQQGAGNRAVVYAEKRTKTTSVPVKKAAPAPKLRKPATAAPSSKPAPKSQPTSLRSPILEVRSVERQVTAAPRRQFQVTGVATQRQPPCGEHWAYVCVCGKWKWVKLP